MVYERMKPLFESRGFRRRKGEIGLVRAIPGGRQEVGFPVWDYRPIFKFSLVASIRIEDVENLVNMFNEAPAKYHSSTITIATPLEYFLPGAGSDYYVAKNWRPYAVTSEAEVDSSCHQLSSIVSNRVIPFLEGHTDVASLDVGVNCDPVSINNMAQPSKGMRRILLAHLNHNPNYQAIVDNEWEEIRQRHQMDQDRFLKLAEYLRCQRAQFTTATEM
jgi:hypothetical protein